MKNHGFTAVPVIDREGRYVKTLAEGDFLWFMLNNGIQDMRELEKYRISEITRRVRMKPSMLFYYRGSDTSFNGSELCACY